MNELPIEEDPSQVVEVICKPKKGYGYYYVAVLKDGTTRIARKTATRFYPRAYRYVDPTGQFCVQVASGGNDRFAKTFTYGQAPSSYYKKHCQVLVFEIKEPKP